MTPAQVVSFWIDRFNAADIEGLMELYCDDAVNHQVVTTALHGKSEIRRLFETEFARARMECIPVSLHEAGEWAILEWRDPLGLQGCGFFHVQDDRIVLQRGYFDQLTFFKIHGLRVPEQYLDR